jgi:hypothetical protein
MEINFTPSEAHTFKKCYNKAKSKKRSSFNFKGETFFTRYAKYVVEYLEPLMETLN